MLARGCAEDANNDDIITGDDYTIWRKNFGRAGLSNGGGSQSKLRAAFLSHRCW